MGIFPIVNRVAFPKESQLQQNHAIQPQINYKVQNKKHDSFLISDYIIYIYKGHYIEFRCVPCIVGFAAAVFYTAHIIW